MVVDSWVGHVSLVATVINNISGTARVTPSQNIGGPISPTINVNGHSHHQIHSNASITFEKVNANSDTQYKTILRANKARVITLLHTVS